ncbi:hypothetical protein KAW18_01040 [candidate division WOR-3 bacterium]|nr:hypothetical protein [candidate division WOR-3 bacterium]
MNDQLETYARNTLKEGLAQCSDSEQLVFKRMYSYDNLDMPLSKIVDGMDPDRLDWAMDQVKRTLNNKRDRGL